MKKYQVKAFGKLQSGEEVKCYTLENNLGDSVSVMEYGAVLTAFKVCEPEGMRNLVLGYDSAAEYETRKGCLGAVCGPVANRITLGEFRLNDHYYRIGKNDGNNVCHSGEKGFGLRLWELIEAADDHLIFKLSAADGQDGFPGNREIQVTYAFNDERQLTLKYHAETDKDTVFNLTNHAYFNLCGAEDISEQYLEMNSSFYTPVDEHLIPTGEIRLVEGTGFDIRNLTKFSRIFASEDEAIKQVGGLDHNFIIDAEERNELRYACRLVSPDKQVQLVCYTSEQAVQIYTANGLPEYSGSENRLLGRHRGVCFETQNFPCSPNIAHFPSPVYKPGQPYESCTIYAYTPFIDSDLDD